MMVGSLAVLAVFLFPEPALGGERLHASIPLMGTRFIIHAEKLDVATVVEVKHLGESINHACSDYEIASELSKLNRCPAGEAFALSPALCEILGSALELARLTNGAYDPTMGAHTLHWRKSRRTGELPTKQEVASAMRSTGWQNLELDRKQRTVVKRVEGMRIDLGGIAKGYAADRMFEYLTKLGLKHVSVTAGGDLRLGTSIAAGGSWPVELRTLASGVGKKSPIIHLQNTAVSTSGDLHQWIEIGGKRYSHIVDPTTGLGLTTRISATVIAPSATYSDALATALCVAPHQAEQIRASVPGLEYMIVSLENDGKQSVQKSPGFPDK